MRKYTLIITILAIVTLNGSFFAFAQSDNLFNSTSDMADISPQTKSSSYGNVSAIVDELDVRNMDVKDVLKIISLKTGVKINHDEEIAGNVTILLREINILDALHIVADMHNLAFIELKSGGTGTKAIHVMSAQRYESLYGYSFGQKKKTESVILLYAEPELLLPQLRQMKSFDGKVVYEENTNSFILIDIPSKVEEMKAFIEQVDIEEDEKNFVNKKENNEKNDYEYVDIDDEVNLKEDDDSLFSIFKIGSKSQKYQIQVNMFEITLNDEHQKGVDWEAIVSNYQYLPFLGFRSTAKHDPEGEIRVGTISDEDYVVLLDALDTVGVMETLEDDKFRGRLEKDYEIDIKPSEKILVTDIREYRDMFKRDEYIRLTFSTTKDPEGLFEIEIEPEIRPNYYTKNVGNLVVKLQDKHVVVIGGIFKDIRIKGTKKIPILGDLPFLGFAFRDNEERIRKVEYVVFLTLENLK